MTKEQNEIFMELIASILNAHPFYGKKDFGTRDIPMWCELPWTPEQIAEAVKVYIAFHGERADQIEHQLSCIKDVGFTCVRVYDNLVMLQVLTEDVYDKLIRSSQDF